jgi:hypothetical protein
MTYNVGKLNDFINHFYNRLINYYFIILYNNFKFKN